MKQARFMTGGLMDRLTGIAVWQEKVDLRILKIAQERGWKTYEPPDIPLPTRRVGRAWNLPMAKMLRKS